MREKRTIAIGSISWDGEILRLDVTEPIPFEGAAVEEYHAAARELIGDRTAVPLLVKAGLIQYTSREGRRAVVHGEAYVGVRALVVENESQRTIARTFLMHEEAGGPPTEVFFNEARALGWLREYAARE